jgi:hypothetical protein
MVVELYSIYIVVMGWGGPFGCPARSVVEHVTSPGLTALEAASNSFVHNYWCSLYKIRYSIVVPRSFHY